MSDRTTLNNFVMKQKRSIFFYENHFREFYLQQNSKVRKKILWTLQLIETIERIPELYFKHIKNPMGCMK